LKEGNPFPDRTGTISVVNQQETIEKIGERMLQNKPYKMAGCISKLLGSPAYASDTSRFIFFG
jgi:hypothetical protein